MKNANLILHCGAHAVERSVLESTPTPPSTDTWQPVPHAALLGTVEKVLVDHGLTITSQAHGLTHDGNRYFGLMEVHNGNENPEYARVLGLRNSHDKCLPAAICAGSQILVCDNLAFSGEIKISRKHTTFIMRDLPDLIKQTVAHLISTWHELDNQIQSYKSQRLSDRSAHDLTIRAMDGGVFCASKIPEVIHEWRQPRHDAFAPRNVWSWFNAVTEVVKGNLAVLPGRTQALHRLCDAFVART